ncbi:MAG: PAS domain S-box protein [Bacteroidia bacterium]
MMTSAARLFKYPLVSAFGVFLLILGLTQFLAYQEYRFAREQEVELLKGEAGNARDRLRNILYADITAANSLALIYKEYGIPENFDSISSQIIKNSLNIETIVLVEGSVITKVYPLNDQTRRILGGDVMADSVVRNEIEKAMARQAIYFSGPRKLHIGGEGIWGEVPVIKHGKIVGYVGVLTRLPALRKALDISPNGQGKFAYLLSKASQSPDSSMYLLSVAKPGENKASAWVSIPEGDWTLKVVFSTNYLSTPFPYKLSLLSLILSLVAGLFAYWRFDEPRVLQKVIEQKTHQVNERVKELTTIYQVNKLLQNEDLEIREVFEQMVGLLRSGWQYEKYCEARIIFDGRTFITPGYEISAISQLASFELADGRQGSIEVIYTKEMPAAFEGPFLKEERDLIDAIAEIVEIYFNKAIQQRALSESEAKFRGAFEHSATGMGLVSNEGRWQSVNKGLCEMLGYTEDELLELTFVDITHPDDLGWDMENREKMLRGEQDHYQAEKRYLHKKGFIVWVSVNVAVIRAGAKPVYFVVQIENITERIESQLKFRNLVEKSPVSVYIFQHNRFVYVNPALVHQSGYNEEELLELPLTSFIHEDDIAKVVENIQMRLDHQQDESRYQIRAYTKDGEMLWIEIHGAATLYEGSPAVIGTMVDITHRVKMELEREKILEDIIQRNRDLEEFSYIVSHDIRAPLATLLGLGNLLKLDLPEEEKSLVVQGMGECADRLDQMVKDVTRILDGTQD